MIVRLVVWLRSWLCSIDWTLPLTVEARGGGPALDRALAEARIRDDERARVLSQQNTAFGQPPRKPRIGDYFPNGQVPQ